MIIHQMQPVQAAAFRVLAAEYIRQARMLDFDAAVICGRDVEAARQAVLAAQEACLDRKAEQLYEQMRAAKRGFEEG